MNIEGNYRVARVVFPNSINNKIYSFALFDDSVNSGDYVVVKDANGFGVARIHDIIYQENNTRKITAEVAAKIDFSEYDKRVNKRTELAAIKKQMDKIVKENQSMYLYNKIAEENTEMAELLQHYKELKQDVI